MESNFSKKKNSDREPKRGHNILKAPIRVMFTSIRDMEKKNSSISFDKYM